MTETKSRPRIVRCPACGGPSVYGPENPYRPFCSKRCKTQDLGAWASEQYRVEAADTAPVTPTATEQQPPHPTRH